MSYEYCEALAAQVRLGPRRSSPRGIVETWLRKGLQPDKRIFLEALLWHQAANLVIGSLVISERCIDASFDQPMWIKDGPGPDDGCYAQPGVTREDILAFGRDGAIDGGGLVIFECDGMSVREACVTLDGWSQITTAFSLEELLERFHEAALATGKPSALPIAPRR